VTPPTDSDQFDDRPDSRSDAATGRDEAVARIVTLAMLLSTGPVTLVDVRDRMPREYGGSQAASRKRFQRDKDTLESIGFCVAVDGDRYWLATPTTPSTAPRRGLTAPERFAVADAIEAVAGAVTADVRRLATSAVLKLRAGEADPPATADSVTPGADTVVVTFENARRTESALAFAYTTAAGETSQRVVHPWAVGLRDGVWLVFGWDDTRRAARHFRADGVARSSLRTVDTAYRPSPGTDWVATRFAVDPWVWGDGTPLDATVLLAGTAPPAEEDLPPGTVVETTDDDRFGFRLTVAVRDPGPFLSWLLRFGRHARLDGPDEIVRRLRSRLSATLAELERATPLPGHGATLDTTPVDMEDAPTAPTLRPSARRAARILRLLGLASGGHVARDRLADVLGCTPAELDADLAQLFEHCYLPPDSGGNWFDLDPAGDAAGTVRVIGPEVGAVAELTDLETAALGICLRVHLATHPADATTVRTLRDALDVLGLAPPGVTERAVDSAEFPVFASVASAVRASRRVRFTYVADGATTEREVDPQRLSVSAGRRYLTGWDHLRNAQRAFRLDRITELEVTDIVFDPAALVPPPDRADGDPGFVPVGDDTIELVVPTAWARWAERRFGPSSLRHGEGGSVLRLRSNDPGRYAATLLSLLPDCTLVGPPAARVAVRELARAILDDLDDLDDTQHPDGG
jgi:predicted DNA-binding transcriptional regulator YafY